MWHGAQVDARESMRPLADHLAGYGVGAVVADWNSHTDDRGRADLLASLRFARHASAAPDDIVLVGWSLGGVAAAGVNIHAALLGMRVAHTVCLAGAFMAAEPVSGRQIPSDLADFREGARSHCCTVSTTTSSPSRPVRSSPRIFAGIHGRLNY